MKIGMPVESKSLETAISLSFGRTAYYLIYDTDSKESSYIDNGAAASQGGAGIKAAQLLVDQKVEAVITPRCGQNAADVLNAANIKMYQSNHSLAIENIKAFENGNLNLLAEVHEGLHNHGGR